MAVGSNPPLKGSNIKYRKIFYAKLCAPHFCLRIYLFISTVSQDLINTYIIICGTGNLLPFKSDASVIFEISGIHFKVVCRLTEGCRRQKRNRLNYKGLAGRIEDMAVFI